jgi:hypothetical protein
LILSNACLNEFLSSSVAFCVLDTHHPPVFFVSINASSILGVHHVALSMSFALTVLPVVGHVGDVFFAHQNHICFNNVCANFSGHIN